MKNVGQVAAYLVLLGWALMLAGAVLSIPWGAWVELISSQPMGLRFVLMGGSIIGAAILGVLLLAVLGALASTLRRKGVGR